MGRRFVQSQISTSPPPPTENSTFRLASIKLVSIGTSTARGLYVHSANRYSRAGSPSTMESSAGSKHRSEAHIDQNMANASQDTNRDSRRPDQPQDGRATLNENPAKVCPPSSNILTETSPAANPPQLSAASLFFPRFDHIARCSDRASDEVTTNVFLSCLHVYFFLTAGRTVWDYFSQEQRIFLGNFWGCQIFEAIGTEEALEMLKDLCITLFERHPDEQYMPRPQSKRESRRILALKSDLFNTLIIMVTSGIQDRGELPAQLQADMHDLLNSPDAEDDDVIEAMWVMMALLDRASLTLSPSCVCRLMFPTKPLFSATSPRWSARLETFVQDLDEQHIRDGYIGTPVSRVIAPLLRPAQMGQPADDTAAT